jgi:hypothetical protein
MRDKPYTVGVCGNCGGPVIAGRFGDAPYQFPGCWWGNAKCYKCGAKPEPLKMQERREANRDA